MSSALDLLALAQAALKFAQAAREATHSQHALTDAYYAWREANDVREMILRDDQNWLAMMAATGEEYRQMQNARGRKRRAEKKLLALAGEVEGLE